MTDRFKTLVVSMVAIASGSSGFLIGKWSLDRQLSSVGRSAVLPADGGIDGIPAKLSRARDIGGMRPELAAAVAQGLELLEGGDALKAILGVLEIDDPAIKREALFELIGHLDAEGLGAVAMAILRSDDDGEAGEKFGELFDDDMIAGFSIFDRWSELDPDGMAAFLTSPRLTEQSGMFDTESILRVVSLAFLARRDPEFAKGVVDRMPSEFNEDGDLAGFIALGITMRDPAAGVRYLSENGEDGTIDDDIFELVGARSSEALSAVLALPIGEQREDALDGLFGAWGRSSPSEALAAIAALPADEGRERLMQTVLRSYGGTDPRGAASYALELPEGDVRTATLLGIAQQWFNIDPGMALAWSDQHLGSEAVAGVITSGAGEVAIEVGMAVVGEMLDAEAKEAYFEGLNVEDEGHFIWRMMESDAAGTIAWFAENGGIDEVGELGISLGIEAAEQDFAIAKDALAKLPVGAARTDYLVGAAREIARTDPAAALAWASELDANDAGTVRREAAAIWAREDSLAAAEYASGASSDVLDGVVFQWAQRDSAAAYSWLVEHESGDPSALGHHLDNSQLLGIWINEDPAAAADAMALFPADLAPGRIAQVIDIWADDEPSRASTYINQQLDPGPVRDAAVVALAKRIAPSDSAAALDWANSVADDTLREGLLHSLENR